MVWVLAPPVSSVSLSKIPTILTVYEWCVIEKCCIEKVILKHSPSAFYSFIEGLQRDCLGFLLKCSVNGGTLCTHVCVFLNDVQSIHLAAGGCLTTSRHISRTLKSKKRHLKPEYKFEHHRIGSEYLRNKTFQFAKLYKLWTVLHSFITRNGPSITKHYSLTFFAKSTKGPLDES